MPVIAIPRMLLQLVSLIILACAIYLLLHWHRGYDARDAYGVLHHVRGDTWKLVLGLGLLAWSFLGRFVVLMLMPKGKDEPREERGPAQTVMAPDGSALNVETFGSEGAPTIILTHGWGLNANAWWFAKHDLKGRFRLLTWDLPGLGKSKGPRDGKYSIDRFAQALGSVVEASGAARVLLVGHSIGGMTTQTFWRACPEDLKRRVAGMVLVDTTHENPLCTMLFSKLWLALRRPIIEPMCWLTVLLSPLAWLANWQGYLSGSNQLGMRITGFGRFATRGEVDFTARMACKGSPGVQAKGNLAMFHWKATEVLPTISVPVLVLAGDLDIVTLPEASVTIAERVRDGRLQRVSGCNHMGFMEKSQAYNEAIAAFADQVFAAPAPASPAA